MHAAQLDEEAIFNAARKIDDPAERAKYLHDDCPDAALRERIEALLAVHDQERSFLNPPGGAYSPTITERPLSEAPGTVIGAYKLLEQIGEGGFGVVFMAEQSQPVKRKVALKVIKPGMDTREVIARFEAERQALAIMDHPNIARVFDGGATKSGRPFFVMELVRGVPITDYCDAHQLTPRARLELFVTVCQAVQHAHQKGIIHRDIKPTNVLVTLHDDKPVVKVIDFGIAKATSGQLTDKTLFTGFAQLVGTPLYMSPEQASLTAIDIDTRSDIYSLGVLLYELLTGTTPFDKLRLQQAAFEEVRRIIREEEPLKPSTRLSSLGDTLPSVSAVRRMEPHKLSRFLRGDLDWIVMKALEKDRARRYETANGFASDILRYLSDEPVQACPPSGLYRLRKYARRHKWNIAAAALVATCLFVLVLGALVYAKQQRDLALGRTKLASDREQARQEADAARLVAQTELYHALLGRAAAVRTARNPGYRREVWEYLHQAAALRVPDRDPVEIRDEVLACLGDPIGLDPIDFPVAERTPPVVVQDVFQSVINAARARERHITTAVSASGEWLAIRGADSTGITLWGTDGQVIGRTNTPLGPVARLDFSRDGELLVAGCEEGTAVLSVPDLGMQTFFRGSPVYRSLAIHPGGHQLATFDFPGKIEVWSLRSNRPVAAMMSPAGVETIEYSADGALLLGIAADGMTVVKGWPMNATPEKRVLIGHQASVPAVAFSPDGRLLASASKDRTVRLWDVETEQLLHACIGHDHYVQAARFSPDGRWLISAGLDGFVIVWDSATGERLTSVVVPTALWDVDFDSSGRLLAAVGRHRLECWEFTTTPDGLTLDHLRTVPLPNRGVDVAFQPGATMVAVLLQAPEKLLTCDVTGDDVPRQLDARAVVGWNTLQFDRSGERLFFQSTGGSLGVWEVDQARASYLRTKVPAVFHAFTADSRWMAAPDEYPDQVRLFDVPSDRELLVLPQGPHNKTESLAWSPDGARLAVGSNHGDIAIWDLGEVAARLREFGTGLEGTGTQASAVHSVTSATEENVRRRQWEQSAARLAAVLDALPVSLGTNAPRKQFCRGLTDSDEVFVRVSALRPNDPQLPIAWGRRCIDDENWRAAADAYAQVIDRHPIDDEHFEYACLLAILGDQAELERFLRRTAERTDDIKGPFEWYVLARAASAASQAAVAAADAVTWGENAVAAEDHAWFYQALALAHYRAGQFEQALAQARESDARPWGKAGEAVNALVRAMAHHQLGQTAEANSALAEARELMAVAPPPLTTELLSSRLLFAEAEALIGTSRPDETRTTDQTN